MTRPPRTAAQCAMHDDQLSRDLNILDIELQEGGENVQGLVMRLFQRLRAGEEVNVLDQCCGAGFAAEQLQFLLDALCIAGAVRTRAKVVGIDLSPRDEELLHPDLAFQHAMALGQLRGWHIPGIDLEALAQERALMRPLAEIKTAAADTYKPVKNSQDFIFCMVGVPYVQDKLAMWVNAVRGLKPNKGLGMWTHLINEHLVFLDISRNCDIPNQQMLKSIFGRGTSFQLIEKMHDGQAVSGHTMFVERSTGAVAEGLLGNIALVEVIPAATFADIALLKKAPLALHTNVSVYSFVPGRKPPSKW